MVEKILYQITKLPPESREYFEQLFKESSYNFLRTCKIVNIKANKRFVATGERVGNIWICLSGTVKAMEEFETGETYIFFKFPAPEIFGEMEVLAEIPTYRASLATVTDCIFIVGSADEYIKWIKNDANILYIRTQNLLKHFMEESRDNRAYLLLDGTERIKLYFLDHCIQCQDNGICVLKNTRQQIADETGYSVKTVNRVIKKLTEQELITVEGWQITINETQYARMLESIDEKVKYED